jgi:hypothetical protein
VRKLQNEAYKMRMEAWDIRDRTCSAKVKRRSADLLQFSPKRRRKKGAKDFGIVSPGTNSIIGSVTTNALLAINSRAGPTWPGLRGGNDEEWKAWKAIAGFPLFPCVTLGMAAFNRRRKYR